MHALNMPIKVERSSALKAGLFSLCSFHGSIGDIFQISGFFVPLTKTKGYFRLTG